MCHQTTCRKCQKATWRGCGNHIEQALAGVPRNQRCTCATDAPPSGASSGGFFSRRRGR